MALTPSFPGVSGLATTTDGRKAIAGLIATDTSGNARSGVFPAHTNALVTARSDMNVNIAAFQACAVQFGGPILLANDGTAQLPSVLVSPGAGTNYYVVYAKQNESTSPGTDANNNRVFGATVSTASFAAARALLPTGAVELATVEMPTGKTATNQAGVVITQTHRYTAAQGGVVLLRDNTEEATWAPSDGTLAYRLDKGWLRRRVSGGWVGGAELVAEWTTLAAGVPDGALVGLGTYTADSGRTSDTAFATLITNGIRVPAGTYLVEAAIALTGAATGRTFLEIAPGFADATTTRRSSGQTGEDRVSARAIAFYPAGSANDIRIQLFKTNGGANNVTGRVSIVRLA